MARIRTTVLQAHSHHWLGTFGGPLNGDYRGELARALETIISYAGWLCMPLSQIVVRLDGLYGNAAPLAQLLSCGVGVIVRGKDYGLLDRPAVQARLRQPPDQQTSHPESGASRALFDCLDLPLMPAGPRVRVIIATHPATSSKKPAIGVLRSGTVYELFLTTLPPHAFTPADVLELYLHRGSFETVLADEDREQDPDRWCSHTACGKAILANLESVDLESAPGIRTAPVGFSHALDGICSGSGGGGGSSQQTRRVRTSPLGRSILDVWLCRSRFCSAT